MNTIDRIVEEIKQLIADGSSILLTKELRNDHSKLNIRYESWYTKSIAVIQQLIPERLQDFKNAYKIEKRKEINVETYGIHDFLHGLFVKNDFGKERFDSTAVFQSKMLNQISILKSTAESANSLLRDIKTVLRADLLDSDLEAAKELMKNNYLRSSGVIAGVVIESHLKSVADRRGLTLKRKHPSIAEINDVLRENKIYDVPMWRFIQRLADIRNLCAHKKKREPTQSEINDLLSGAEKIIKEIC